MRHSALGFGLLTQKEKITMTQKIAIISAQWNHEIVQSAEDSFIKTMQENGYAANQMDVFKAPGSLEIPLIGQKCLQEGYDLAVGIGFVVNGLIYRHEFVGQEVVRGIVDVSLRTNKPFLSVVLTPQAFQEHSQENIDFFVRHMVVKGQEAASAAMKMLDLQSLKKAA